MTGAGQPLAEEGHRLKYGWLFGVVWLVFLTSPLQRAWQRDAVGERVLGVAAVLLFAAAYVAMMVSGRRRWVQGLPVVWPWAQLGLLVGLGLLMTVASHDAALAGSEFIAALAMFSVPPRKAWVFVVLLAASCQVAVGVVPGWQDHGNAYGVLLAATAVFAVRLAFDRSSRLQETRGELAELAVSAERSRFARDLHDLLGHSLTVIAVKAELAGRLVELDPSRATAEIADLERLAREALADVRGAVSGYRDVTLVRELASAQSALSGAGIAADLPTAVDHVPGELRELFGWAVREGVTNVVRHSGARGCAVRVTARSVEIVDDGCGSKAGPGGNGITGLRERAQAAGARVEHGPTGDGHRLAVVVP